MIYTRYPSKGYCDSGSGAIYNATSGSEVSLEWTKAKCKYVWDYLDAMEDGPATLTTTKYKSKKSAKKAIETMGFSYDSSDMTTTLTDSSTTMATFAVTDYVNSGTGSMDFSYDQSLSYVVSSSASVASTTTMGYSVKVEAKYGMSDDASVSASDEYSYTFTDSTTSTQTTSTTATEAFEISSSVSDNECVRLWAWIEYPTETYEWSVPITLSAWRDGASVYGYDENGDVDDVYEMTMSGTVTVAGSAAKEYRFYNYSIAYDNDGVPYCDVGTDVTDLDGYGDSDRRRLSKAAASTADLDGDRGDGGDGDGDDGDSDSDNRRLLSHRRRWRDLSSTSYDMVSSDVARFTTLNVSPYATDTYGMNRYGWSYMLYAKLWEQAVFTKSDFCDHMYGYVWDVSTSAKTKLAWDDSDGNGACDDGLTSKETPFATWTCWTDTNNCNEAKEIFDEITEEKWAIYKSEAATWQDWDALTLDDDFQLMGTGSAAGSDGNGDTIEYTTSQAVATTISATEATGMSWSDSFSMSLSLGGLTASGTVSYAEDDTYTTDTSEETTFSLTSTITKVLSDGQCATVADYAKPIYLTTYWSKPTYVTGWVFDYPYDDDEDSATLIPYLYDYVDPFTATFANITGSFTGAQGTYEILYMRSNYTDTECDAF